MDAGLAGAFLLGGITAAFVIKLCADKKKCGNYLCHNTDDKESEKDVMNREAYELGGELN